MAIFTGAGVAIVTPMLPTGEVLSLIHILRERRHRDDVPKRDGAKWNRAAWMNGSKEKLCGHAPKRRQRKEQACLRKPLRERKMCIRDRNHSIFSLLSATVLMFRRCFTPTFAEAEFPPQEPQPKVKEGSSLKLYRSPIPPCEDGVLIRIRQVFIASECFAIFSFSFTFT